MTAKYKDERPVVVVIDDDKGVRESLELLFQSVNLDAEFFASVHEFTSASRTDRPGCMVLDIRLPGKSGLDFQSELAARSIHIPIIFVTAHGDIPMTVRAMKAGAVEFLTKPYREQELLDAIHGAFALDRNRRQEALYTQEIMACFAALNARERSVMKLVVNGAMNKEIAWALDLAEVTVKKYRAQVMQKMKARSLAELVKKAEQCASVFVKNDAEIG
jgi:FixJ family two-component response regulator